MLDATGTSVSVVVKVCVPVLFQLLLVSFAKNIHPMASPIVLFKVLVTLLQSGLATNATAVSLDHVPVLLVLKI